MSSIISLGRSELLPNGFNNTLSFEFTNSSLNFKNMEIALNSIQMYNSQFNISGDYSNTSFTIAVPTGSGFANVVINMPDGYYSYEDMSNFVQQKLIEAGAYLIDNLGEVVVYFKLRENRTYYAAQVDCLAVPSSLPVGWSRPAIGFYSSGGSGLPTTPRTTTLILSGNGFKDIIGFKEGSYPATTSNTDKSFLSVVSPQINPVSAYIVRCNLVNNAFTNPSDVLTVFSTQGTDIGQLIDVKPNELSWIKVSDGSYSNITLTITDQNGDFVSFQDSNILITLLIRERQ